MFSSRKTARPSLRDIRVRHAGALVHLTFHRITFDIHYRDALQIAQWIRVYAKESRRHARETSISQFGAPVRPDEPFVKRVRLTELGADAMRQELAQKTPVRVMALEERVAIRIGACAWAIHFVDAFDLAAAIRTHAKAAKKEQGDESRTLLRAGVLSDAERNYKHGI